jgi:hypothetical protein
MELSNVMSFLLQLGFIHVGQAAAFSALSPQDKTVAAHMMQLGLLHPFMVVAQHPFMVVVQHI